MELVLLFDTLVDPAPTGVRGTTSARHLLFHCDDWDLDLMISRSSDSIGLTGQVLPREAVDLSSVFNAVVILLQGGDELVQSARLSSRGEFEFQAVPDSNLRLEIFLKAHRLTASFRP